MKLLHKTIYQAPFFKFTSVFILGIISAYYVDISSTQLFVILSICGLVVFLSLFPKIRSNLRVWRMLLIELCVLLLVFGSGVLVFNHHRLDTRKNWFALYYKEGMMWKGKINFIQKESENSINAFVSIEQLYTLDSPQKTLEVKGIVSVYFSNSGRDSIVENRFFISDAPIRLLKKTPNPGMFDYGEYLNRKNIFHQTFIEDHFRLLGKTNPSTLSQWVQSIQAYLDQTLSKYIHSPPLADLAKMLLYGARKNLDKELLTHYAQAGVIHVISVSGLHVGIVAWFVGVVLKRVRKRKNMFWIFALLGIQLIIIWMFLLVSGGSASILRACIMFSILEILKFFPERLNNPYQNLSIAAFVILLINPMDLWQLGFIFSFAALLGIYAFGPYFKRLFSASSNYVIHYVEEAISTSLSAQVFITPISIYLFHYFGIYFLLSNVLVIFISIVALYAAILCCVFGRIEVLGEFFGWTCEYLLRFMNGIVDWIQSLPHALIADIPLTFIELISILLFVVSILYWLYHRDRNKMHLMFLSLTLVLAVKIGIIVDINRQEKTILYDSNTESVMAVVQGNRMLHIKQENSPPSSYNIALATKTFFHIDSLDTYLVKKTPCLFEWQGKKILYIDHLINLKNKINVDILLTREKLDSTWIKKNVQSHDIVFQNKYKPSLIQWIQAQACAVHIINREGAWIWNAGKK